MSSIQPATVQPFQPIFEGFFLQMVKPEMEAEVRTLVTQFLAVDWQIKAIGDGSTQFEILPPAAMNSAVGKLSIKEIWETSYRLRSAPGVIDAEPLFGVPLPEQPANAAHNFSANAAFSLNIDLPESDDPEWSLKQLKIFEAWAQFFPNKTPGEGTIVGHPDTGYRRHPEIIDNLLIDRGYDFVDGDNDAQDELIEGWGQTPGHGTGTSSVIISPRQGAGNYPSGKAVTGVAPGAKLVPFRVSPSVVLLSPDNLSEAIERATDAGVHVISISMGTGFFNKRLLAAVLYAQKRGVIVAAAAGNYVGYVVWPAAYDEVIAVAACNAQRRTWYASSRGSQVDVTAPGESVWRAQVYRHNDELINDVNRGSGTSFAVAAVAGIAALWLSYHGREQLIERYGAEKIPIIFNQILRQSCEPMPSWDEGDYGAGLVDATKVLDQMLPDDVNFVVPAAAFSLQDHVTIDAGELATFAHLFQPVSTTLGSEDSPGSLPTRLRTKLAELLKLPESELPLHLKQVGQELAFHFAANPDLYNRFAETLAEPGTAAAFSLDGAETLDLNMELIRGGLEAAGASSALKSKTA